MTTKKKKKTTLSVNFCYLDKLTFYGYLWEFIRRNKTYQKLFKSYQKELKRLNRLSWYGKMHDKKLHKIIKACADIKIKFPLDPSKKADDFNEDYLRDNLIYKKGVNFITSCGHVDRTVLVHEALEEIGLNERDFVVRINADTPIDKILADIKKLVINMRSALKRPQKFQRRIRKEWKDYIIAYELKKNGRSTKEIAQHIFPNDNNTYPEYPASKKVSRYIKEVNRLINGGYKELLP